MGDELDTVAAATRFSGVVRADRGGEVVVERAYGLAHRGLGLPNTPATRFAAASGAKGLTALAVMSLVEDGTLGLDTTARSLLGGDLPLIDDAVTVEHLLAHRSGIGDYLDESALESGTAYVMPVPVHRLGTAEDYLQVLDGFPQVSPPGERFAYNNGGFVVLALLAERAARVPYHDHVRTRVCAPAGMRDTAFLRGDEPDGGVALGYLEPEGLRTNVLHLPVRGVGDGGNATTAADMRAFWTALFAGRIVPPARVAEMVAPRSDADDARYGLGFWLAASGPGVVLVGSDAGVSFHSTHDPDQDLTATVIANVTDGAWDMAEALERVLDL